MTEPSSSLAAATGTPDAGAGSRANLAPVVVLPVAVAAVLAFALGGPKAALLVVAAAGFLGLMLCLVFRPYWYVWLLFPALLSWSYAAYVKGSLGPSWLDLYSPWTIRIGPMPVADLLLLLAPLRVVLDPRFARFREWHPLDRAMGVFVLSYLPAALIGMLHRDATQTWTLWFFSVRGPILIAATYLAASRLIPTDRPSGPRGFLFAPLVGLLGAILGAAYRAFVLHQIQDRAGAPVLLISEANMLPTMATLGVAYLATSRQSRGGKALAIAGITLALAILLVSTRRSVMLFAGFSLVALLFFLPRPHLRRALGIFGVMLVLVLILGAALIKVSGPIGKLWLTFMSGGGAASQVQGVSDRRQEVDNVAANLDKYGGWVFGQGLGRRWERLLPQRNLYFGAGFGDDKGHVWIFPLHVFFLPNLLQQGLFGLAVMAVALMMIMRMTLRLARQPVEGGEEELLNRALLAATLAGILVSILYYYAYPNAGIFSGALLATVDGFLRMRYAPVPAATTDCPSLSRGTGSRPQASASTSDPDWN